MSKEVAFKVTKLELVVENIMKVEAVSLSTNKEMKFSLVKKKIESFAINIGDEYVAKIEEDSYTDKRTGEIRKGYKAWYSSLAPLTDANKPVASTAPEPAPAPTMYPPTVPVTSEVDWDGKERRLHRRACLAIASSVIGAWYPKEENTTGEDTLALLVQKIADQLIEYVYQEEGEKAEAPKTMTDAVKAMGEGDTDSEIPF